MSSWIKGRHDYRKLMDSVSADARAITTQLDSIAMPRVSSLDVGRESEPPSSRGFESVGEEGRKSSSLRVRVASPSEIPKEVQIRNEAIQTLHKISNLLVDKRAPPQVEGALIDKGLQLLDALRGCRERVQRNNVQRGSYLTLMSTLGRDVSKTRRAGRPNEASLEDGTFNPWVRLVEKSYLWPHQLQAFRHTDSSGKTSSSSSRPSQSTNPVPLFLEEAEIAGLVLDLLDDHRSLKASPNNVSSSSRRVIGKIMSVATGGGGGSEAGSPTKGDSRYSTSQRQPPPPPSRGTILVSEDYNELLKEHFLSYVRPTPSGVESEHPVHACISRFLSQSDSLILQIARHENLQIDTSASDDLEAELNFSGGTRAALSQWLAGVNGASLDSDSSTSESDSCSRSVSPIHDDISRSNVIATKPSSGHAYRYLPCCNGIVTSRSAESVFLRDRMLFVAALCEMVLEKMFGEKQIPVYIQSMHVGCSSSALISSQSPERGDQSFTSAESKRSKVRGSVAAGSEGSYDDTKTDVSSRASTVAFGQSRNSPRLDITVPIVEVLPELLDGQVEMLSIQRVYDWARDYMMYRMGTLTPTSREQERRRVAKLYLDPAPPQDGVRTTGLLGSLIPTEESATKALLDGAAAKLAHHLLKLGDAILGPKRTILFVDEFYETFVDSFLVCYNVVELALTDLPGTHEGADIMFPGLVHVVAHSQMYALICGLLRWVAVSPIATRLPALSNSKGMEAYVLQSFAAAANAVISAITAPEASTEDVR